VQLLCERRVKIKVNFEARNTAIFMAKEAATGLQIFTGGYIP
jgi:hypothetical protein